MCGSGMVFGEEVRESLTNCRREDVTGGMVFVFLCGFMTITLQDVAAVLGLPSSVMRFLPYSTNPL